MNDEERKKAARALCEEKVAYHAEDFIDSAGRQLIFELAMEIDAWLCTREDLGPDALTFDEKREIIIRELRSHDFFFPRD
jgi:hypothetical protein